MADTKIEVKVSQLALSRFGFVITSEELTKALKSKLGDIPVLSATNGGCSNNECKGEDKNVGCLNTSC